MINDALHIENSFKVFTDRAKGDRFIWACVALLMVVSWLLVYTATGWLAYHNGVNPGRYLITQILLSFGGLLVIYFLHRVNYALYSRIALICYLISIPLLIYTMVNGTSLNGSRRWITLPVINQTFQTSDFAKLALFMFLSRQLSRKQKVIKDFKQGFLPLIIPVAITCLLILPANLSTALLTGVAALILMFIGRVRIKHIFLVIFIALFALAGLVSAAVVHHYANQNAGESAQNAKASEKAIFKKYVTWRNRIENFIYRSDDGDIEQLKAIDQEQSAKIAIANGNVLYGLGPGNSRQRYHLPESYSDFIFSIIIEEYGLLGGVFIIFIYLVFLYRCIRVFRKCPFAFGAFLALGLGFTLVVQAIANMIVSVGLVPVTGVTLPLISVGGTSFLFFCAAIGIVLSVASNVEKMEGNVQRQSIANTERKIAVTENID